MSELSPNPSGSPLLDPSALRIPVGARHNPSKKIVRSSLAIRKPERDEWVYVHSDPNFHWQHLWGYEKDKKHFILVPEIYDDLESPVRRVFSEWDFYLTSVRNEDPIIWPVKHSDTDYFRTLHEAVQAAMTGWQQVQSDLDLKRYNYRPSEGYTDKPDWTGYLTELEAQTLFTRTFRERLIRTDDHEVLERLRGRK